MAQSYYDYSETFQNGSTANATEIATEFEAIQTGLDGVYDYTVAQFVTTNDRIETVNSNLGNSISAISAFAGVWSELTGALNMPAAVLHSGSYWILTSDLADVTAKEPGVDSEWVNASKEPIVRAASGAITAGDQVILNADNTVSSITGVNYEQGSSVNYSAWYGNARKDMCYDTANDKVLLAYIKGNDFNKLVARVGTVSGTTITFSGSEVEISTDAHSRVSCCYDSDSGKVVVVTNRGEAWVGTIAGSAVTFESAVTFDANVDEATCCYTSNSKTVVVFSDSASPFYGFGIVGTISAGTISFGTAVEFSNSSRAGPALSCCYDSNADKVVVVYQDQGSGNDLKGVVGTVSGTSISFGTPADAGVDSNSGTLDSVFDSDTNQVLIAGYFAPTSGTPTSVLTGSVSGTDISFGTRQDILTGVATTGVSISYDNTSQIFTVVYDDASNSSYGSLITGSVSGTDVTLTSETNVFASVHTDYPASIFDPDSGNTIVLYADADDTYSAEAIVIIPHQTNATSNNYFGIAQDTVIDGSSVNIKIFGYVDDNQSGLTVNSLYYIDSEGDLTTVNTSVFCGKAISATEIQIGLTHATGP